MCIYTLTGRWGGCPVSLLYVLLTHTSACEHVDSIHTYRNTEIYACMHAYMRACIIPARVHARARVHVHVHVHIHMHMHIHTHTHTHIHIHIQMHIHIHIHTL